MKNTIISRVETLTGIQHTDTNRWMALLIACGVGYEHVCQRCGGSGFFGGYGVCFDCGNGAARRYWTYPKRLTREHEALIVETFPAIRHALGTGQRFDALAKLAAEARRWFTSGGPFTRKEWVRREGIKVANRLSEQAAQAKSNRERRERENARKAEWARRDEEIGYAEIPEHGRRVEVVAEVLTTRDDHNGYGPVRKALLKAEVEGATLKLWGNLPGAVSHAERGDRIAFRATLKRSDKDARFGFFKRPTRAKAA